MPKNNSENDIEMGLNLKRFRGAERTKKFIKISTDLVTRGRYLTPSAKWLYVALRSFKNEKKGDTFPGYQKIMERSGLSRNAIAKGLEELEQWGWIVRDKSQGKTNHYKFTYPALLNVTTRMETGDQTFPTKEMASDWAKKRRDRKNNKKLLNEKNERKVKDTEYKL
jgi:DNA-binding HxlR family transcriptional regulator